MKENKYNSSLKSKKPIFFIFSFGMILGLFLSRHALGRVNLKSLFFLSQSSSASEGFISPLTDSNHVLGISEKRIISYADLLNQEQEKTAKLKWENEDKSKKEVTAEQNNENTNTVVSKNIGTNFKANKNEISQTLVKKNLKVVLFGDSMIQTMGDLAGLEKQLEQDLGGFDFELFNYGVGSQNIDDAFSRLSNSYIFEDKNMPSLFSLEPDIIILESFAYNPFAMGSDEAFAHYKESLLKTINYLKSNSSAKIYFLLTIAPNEAVFAKNLAWDQDRRVDQTNTIITYLKNAHALVREAGVSLIDCFTPSLNSFGQGNLLYINKDDGIHPSSSGISFVSNLIAKSVKGDILKSL